MTAKITKVDIRYIPDDALGGVFGKAALGKTDGYLPVDALKSQDMPGLQHGAREANHPRNLETVYRAYQAGDRPTQLGIRPMSFGDAIVIDNVGYYVHPNGFVTRDANGELHPVT